LPNAPDNTGIPRTEVLYGAENAEKFLSRVVSGANTMIDVCEDFVISSTPASHRVIKERILEARMNFRYLTEVRKDNIPFCKELMKVGQVRHLDGIRTNFVVTDTEYTSIMQQVHTHPEIVYSNVKSIVEQQRYLFEHLWNEAIPAERKIREIEEGIIIHETKIIENPDEIVKEISMLTANSNQLSTCVPSGGMQYSYKYFFDIKKKLLDSQRRGEHNGIRYVTNIDKDNIHIVKIYLESGIQIRHVRNLPPMSFGVSDKKIAVTIEKMEGGTSIQSLLLSSEPPYVNHFTSIFEELWRNGIDASDRIRNIEEGVHMAEIEVIENPKESLNLATKISTSAKEELSVLFSTPNSFRRQVDAGLENSLREHVKRGIRVRLLIPFHKEIANTIEQFKRTFPQVDLKSIDVSIQTKMAIVLGDRKECLLIETKDDTKDNHVQAAGISIYSNSKSIVSSYVYIFDSLWKQGDLYEQLKTYNLLQKEFINIASHEMKTPTQAILGLSEVLLSKYDTAEQSNKDLLYVINKNARRLKQLIDDILDVTKIESQTLNLRNERFNLYMIIMDVIGEYETLTKKYQNNLKILFTAKDDFIIVGDKGRISQVVSNLLSNAIKFTKEGSIIVSAVRISDDKYNKFVNVSVKDTGVGIDPEILPRLFSKFTTKSNEGGTGLGLFISKSIIEALGGRIWGENNTDGKGATFTFSLPLNRNEPKQS
jgi:two-component system, OmpR family, sensor histidine kinase VicK